MAAFDEAQIFFFPPFRSFQKIFKVCPLGGDCTVISDGHARRRLSEKKTSLFYIIHTNSIALSVEHTKEEHVKEEAFRDQNREKRGEKRARLKTAFVSFK